MIPHPVRMEYKLTSEEFDVLYAALQIANHPYTEADVPHLVAMEGKAWGILQVVKERS